MLSHEFFSLKIFAILAAKIVKILNIILCMKTHIKLYIDRLKIISYPINFWHTSDKRRKMINLQKQNPLTNYFIKQTTKNKN